MAVKKKRNRRLGRSKLLETAVEHLRHYGFIFYDSQPAFDSGFESLFSPRRYVVLGKHQLTPMGTPSRKEAMIVSEHNSHGFPDKGGLSMSFIVEAKWQENEGSTHEKLAYVWECCKTSPVPNWILLLGGVFWGTTKGKRCAEYWGEKDDDAIKIQRRFIVVNDFDRNSRYFADLVRKIWG